MRLILLVVLVFVVTVSTASTAFFWQITDTHLDPAYIDGSSTDHQCESGQGDAPKFGHHHCDTPFALLEDTIAYMAAQRSATVLWTGDDISHFHNTKPDDPNYVLGTMRNTTNLLLKYFGDSLVVPILGNHDTHPEGQLEPGPNWLLNNASKMWSDAGFLNATQRPTFEHGGYFAVDLPQTGGKCQVAAINTDWYYDKNKMTPHTGDTDGQFEWLEGVLEAAKQDGRKVLIGGHIPMGGKCVSRAEEMICSLTIDNHHHLTSSRGGFSYLEYPSVKLQGLVEKYSDVITGHINGHVHADTVKVFREGLTKQTPISVQYCAQAVTPFDTRNPGVRLFEYDTETCELLDYTQHYFPMNDTVVATVSRWQPLYSAKAAFGLDDMSPKSWGSFIGRLEKDEALWDTYYGYYHSSKVGELPLAECKIGSLCHHHYMCALSQTQKVFFEACYWI